MLFRHLLPNALSALLVQASVDVPRAVELEASLSFLGLGVAVTTPSLGLRVAQGYQYLFGGSWWPSVIPGLALVLLVLAENLIGDWARDALDPQYRGRTIRAAALAKDSVRGRQEISAAVQMAAPRVMVREGGPSTSFSVTTPASRGWPAFADHDTGGCVLGFADLVIP